MPKEENTNKGLRPLLVFSDVGTFVKFPRLRALGPFPTGKGPSASKLRARERRMTAGGSGIFKKAIQSLLKNTTFWRQKGGNPIKGGTPLIGLPELAQKGVF